MNSETNEQKLHEKPSAVIVAETLRLGGSRSPVVPDYLTAAPAKSEDGIPLFWRVFGGTLLSIVALVCLTIYNQFTTSISDLRRDLVQVQESRNDLIRKDEFNGQIAKLWNGLKELNGTNSTLGALNERLRVMDQQLEKQIKIGEDDRKELRTKLDELRKTSESDRKDHHRDVDEVRKNSEAAVKELARKLDEQFKAAQEDRKELHRKFEEQIRALTDERRELNQKLQVLAERLATVEGRQAVAAQEKKAPGIE